MAAGSWSNQQQFANHRRFQLDVINLAAFETIKHYIFNRLQLSADGTQNTATTPRCNVVRYYKNKTPKTTLRKVKIE